MTDINNKTSGLIVNNNLHACKVPNFISRLLYKIKGTPIKNKSLWRCTCGLVYMWDYDSWSNSDLHLWVDAGGVNK